MIGPDELRKYGRRLRVYGNRYARDVLYAFADAWGAGNKQLSAMYLSECDAHEATKRRLVEAEKWRRGVVDAWNAWGLHGDSPGMMAFAAALAGEEKDHE
jgi:hypothetical protein